MKVRVLLAAVAAGLRAGSAYGQSAPGMDGRWEGAIAQPNGSALIGVFNVATRDGKTTATFDAPNQGVRGLAATIERVGDKVTLGVPAAQMIYTATLSTG